MKKVRINNIGCVQTLNEYKINCPMSYNFEDVMPCTITCMWFNIVEHGAGDNRIKIITCHDIKVAELVEDKP